MSKKTAPDRSGELQALREFYAYNAFVRKRYLDFFVKLPKETVTRDRGASFPSIIDIYAHLLDALRSWIHVYETGEDLPSPGKLSISQLVAFEAEVDPYLDRFMKKVKPEELGRPFSFKGTNGKTIKIRSLSDTLWHLIEEELQHRGEINALLWQDDIDPPITDWLDWRRETAKKAAR